MASQVKVVFRKFNRIGDIVALFPYEIADTKGNCTAYQHVGQHGAADYEGCIAVSKPATPEEYAPLLKELQRIGYEVKVIRRKGKRR